MYISILVVSLIIVLINTYISIGAIRNSFYERNQKIAHLMMIWLIPILGALIIWRFVSEVEPNSFPFGLKYKTKSYKANNSENKDVNDEVIKYESWND